MSYAILQPGPQPDYREVLTHPLARMIYGRSCLYYARFGRPMPEFEIKKIEMAFAQAEGSEFAPPPFDPPPVPPAPRYWGIWNKTHNTWDGPEYFPLKSIAELFMADLVAHQDASADEIEVREFPADPSPLE